jgi:hypothetical protein
MIHLERADFADRAVVRAVRLDALALLAIAHGPLHGTHGFLRNCLVATLQNTAVSGIPDILVQIRISWLTDPDSGPAPDPALFFTIFFVYYFL